MDLLIIIRKLNVRIRRRWPLSARKSLEIPTVKGQWNFGDHKCIALERRQFRVSSGTEHNLQHGTRSEDHSVECAIDLRMHRGRAAQFGGERQHARRQTFPLALGLGIQQTMNGWLLNATRNWLGNFAASLQLNLFTAKTKCFALFCP